MFSLRAILFVFLLAVLVAIVWYHLEKLFEKKEEKQIVVEVSKKKKRKKK